MLIATLSDYRIDWKEKKILIHNEFGSRPRRKEMKKRKG